MMRPAPLCSANDPQRTRRKCAEDEIHRFLRASGKQWSASYSHAFAMIIVSPAAVSATSNTMIKDAPRATPIRPTKTPIKRQSTIRAGAPSSISSITRTYATGFVSVLALTSGAPKYGDMTILYLGRGRIVQQKIGTYRQTRRPVW